MCCTLVTVVGHGIFSVQDRSNIHKGSRGSPVSSLPQLGPSAAMMPHGSYISYGPIIRPPHIHHMPPHLGRVTNDLGPPIFMPCECLRLLVVIYAIMYYHKSNYYAIGRHSYQQINSCAISLSLSLFHTHFLSFDTHTYSHTPQHLTSVFQSRSSPYPHCLKPTAVVAFRATLVALLAPQVVQKQQKVATLPSPP